MIRFHCDGQTKKFSKTGFISPVGTWSMFGAHRVKDAGFCHSVMSQAYFFSYLLDPNWWPHLHPSHPHSIQHEIGKGRKRAQSFQFKTLPRSHMYVLFPCPGQKLVKPTTPSHRRGWEVQRLQSEVSRCKQSRFSGNRLPATATTWQFDLVPKAD